MFLRAPVSVESVEDGARGGVLRPPVQERGTEQRLRLAAALGVHGREDRGHLADLELFHTLQREGRLPLQRALERAQGRPGGGHRSGVAGVGVPDGGGMPLPVRLDLDPDVAV